MDNLRAVIKLFFTNIQYTKLPPAPKCMQELVAGKTQKWLCKELMYLYPTRYNYESCEQLFEIFKTEWLKPVNSNYPRTLFNLLYHYTSQMLQLPKGDLECKADQLLRWRELAGCIGEDILTTNYLANQTTKTTDFTWSPHIPIGNSLLLQTSSPQYTDLHFHLGGSSLNFMLNWLCLMNYTFCLKDKCMELDNKYKKGVIHILKFNDIPDKTELYHECILASLIRLFLYRLINPLNDAIKDPIFVDLFSDFNKILKYPNLHQHNLEKKIEQTRNSLNNPIELKKMDYAIQEKWSTYQQINILLTGERRILYHTFKYINTKQANWEEVGRIFYVYLLIKQKIRAEIIQYNPQIGLQNFKDYNGNGQIFKTNTSSPPYDVFSHLAIRSSFNTQYLKYLEVRTSPVSDYSNEIKKMDQTVNDNSIYKPYIIPSTTKTPDYSSKFHYIIHFLKPDKRNIGEKKTCRYHDKRIKYMKEAELLIKFLNSYDQNYHRIAGIDAAGSEMYCRPELFGPCFRYIRTKYRKTPDENDITLKYKRFKLGFTFHVGEDYPDITDGLRAIEEAILFLDLHPEDRISHLLAMGENADTFYWNKNYTIILHRQDRLDNLVWLYQKTKRHFSFCRQKIRFLNRLKTEAKKLFAKIYPNDYSWDITNYYYSMLLRGDDPSLYLNENKDPEFAYTPATTYKLLDHPLVKKARSNKSACELFYRYHFSKTTKESGNVIEEFKISKEEIILIKMTQKKIRELVKKKNIFVECNPTSNILIGNNKRYASHPILSFYTKGLNNIYQIPKTLSSSINTDDQGVFDTCITNEYELMAIALNKETKISGKKIYSEQNIIKWLDNIKHNAEKQRFRK